MKKLFILFFALVLSIGVKAQTPLTQAVDFSTIDHNGNEINLFEILDRGQYVLIYFFYTSSFPDQNAIPKVVDAYYALGCNQHDVFFMEISPTDHNNEPYFFIDNWIETYGVEFPTIYQTSGGTHSGADINNMYQIQGYPTMVLIAPDRQIVLQDIWPIESTQTIIDALTPFGIEEHGANHVISYGNYSLKYTVTSTDPAECEVVCSEQPSTLTEITIPSAVEISGMEFSVTSIGNDAFSYCYNLTSIEIPNSVTSIGDMAFSYCDNLTSIEIPNSVTYIGGYAFYFCSGLTSIEIPASLTYFGQDAITGCSNITSIIVEEENTVYDSRNNCNAIIETSTNTLVAGCKETVIPNTVTSIGFAAFSGCLNLTSIEIPSSVSNIGDYGFYQCYELRNVYCHAVNVPETGGFVFDGGVPSDMVIHVPAPSLEAYQNIYPWSGFAIMPMEITNHWTVDESIYANNMTIIGSVQIDGVSQNSTMLEVGAFCGDELRGSQIAQYIPALDKYEVFLMIYGEANDEITFKLYDHLAKEVLDLVSPDVITFAVNGTLGSVETPYILNFISSEQQIRNLKSGWNWFSSYIELEGGEGLEMMEDALGENGLQIKNQSAFVTNSSSGWYGSLTSVSVQDMFMIETSDIVTMTLEGPKVNPENYTFSLSQGWKWISYPVSESLSVEDALANIYPNHGDNIKSQTAFSQYYNGIGWIGGLNTMNPGEGYMYRNSSDETKTLVYPSSSESKGALKANATAEDNHWIPNVGQFANNMNLIAVVENNSVTDYEIGAFVGDEVRGSARPIYIEALDSYMIFMTIFGEGNEEFSFKYYDLNAKEENVFTEENIIFSANAVFGSVDNPVVMMFDTEGLDENGMENVSIYPNPAAVNSEINLGMTCERVEIYNTLGVKVAEYSDVDKIDGMETSGVYVIRVINDNEMRNYRVVVE